MKSNFVSLFLVISTSLFAFNPDVKTAQNFNHSIKWGFEENKGQVTGEDAHLVKYFFKSGNISIFLLNSGIAYQFNHTIYPDNFKELVADNAQVLAIEREKIYKKMNTETYRMDLELIGANKNPLITTEAISSDYIQYYNHNALNVYSYSKITYHDIYPNIDWIIYKYGENIKYDFIIHPGGNPSNIRLKSKWVENLKLNEDGSLSLKNRMGEVREETPVSFQNHKKINTSFEIKDQEIQFKLDSYDQSLDLIIDPNIVWGTYYGSTNIDLGLDCSNDNLGNIYMTGTTWSNTNIAMGGYSNSFSGNVNAYLVKFNSSGVRQWATYYGGSSGGGFTYGQSCNVDKSGNCYLSGHTQCTADISLNGHQNALGGSYDGYLVKFNPAGGRIWGTYYGGTLDENVYDCKVDKANNVYITGRTYSTNNIFFNGHQSVKSSFEDVLLVKFDSMGSRIWGTYYGGSANDIGYEISIDSSLNVFLVGYSSSTNNISTSSSHQVSIASGSGGTDAFLVKFNSIGVRQWGTYYGGTANDIGSACAIDLQQNIYIGGTTSSLTNISFNGHQNVKGAVGDGFLVKFNTNGVRQWGTYYGGNGGDDLLSIRINKNNNIYVSGGTSSTTNIGFGGFKPTTTSGSDAFIARFNTNGVRQWGSYIGGVFLDYVNSSSTFSDYIYLCGTTHSFNGIALNGHQNTLVGTPSDGFLIKVVDEDFLTISINNTSLSVCTGTPMNLNHNKSIPAGWSNPKYKWYKNNIQVDTLASYTSSTYLTGDSFQCKLIVDSLGLKFDSAWSNVIKITVNTTSTGIQNDSICSGTTYLFNGINRTSSGTYLDTLINHKGCDSFLTLNLLVKPSSSDTIKDSVCKGIAYTFNGNNLSISGTYRDTLINVRGCDSFVTLNFVIKQPSFDTIKDSSCQNSIYVFNGQQLYTSGMYKDTLLNSRGCDSFLVLYLTVKDTTRKDSALNICKNAPILFNGQTINTSGLYRDTFINSKGCDSFLVLNLTVIDSSRKDSSLTICRNSPILFNGQTINTSGLYRDTFTNAKGCDSFLVLNLTVIDSSRKDSSLTICRNSPILFNGKTINTSGLYRDTFTNAKGCDSFLVLNLIVIDSSRKDSSLTICRNSPIVFNGKTINNNGVFRDTFTNARGCDSFLVLNLIVIDSSRKDSSLTICKNSPIVFNGKTISSSGIYRDTFANSKGCDSFLVLNLAVIDSSRKDSSLTICKNSSIIFNGQTINSSGIYRDTFINSKGCDSFLVLNLTVNQNLIRPDFDTSINLCYSYAPPALNNTSLNGIIGIWNPSVIDNSKTMSYVFTPNPNQCALSTTLNVKINSLPIIKFDFYTNDTICIGDSVKISILGESNYNYKWSSGESTSYKIASPYENSSYLVTVTNSYGCNQIETAKIYVRSLLVKISGPNRVNKGDNVQLNVISNLPVKDYNWLPKEYFKEQKGEQAYIKIEEPITVELNVKDSFGCQALDVFPIRLIGKDILVPTGFSPNNDGVNDYFLPIVKDNVKILAFSVYNRWGEVVYNYNSKDKIGWDGKFNEDDCLIGVYNYHLEYSIESKFYRTSGNITLIR